MMKWVGCIFMLFIAGLNTSFAEVEGDSSNWVRVKKYDTLQLLSLSWYGTSYKWKKVAEYNHLAPPYTIVVGRKISFPDSRVITADEGTFLRWRQTRRKHQLPLEGPEYEKDLIAFQKESSLTLPRMRALASLPAGTPTPEENGASQDPSEENDPEPVQSPVEPKKKSSPLPSPSPSVTSKASPLPSPAPTPTPSSTPTPTPILSAKEHEKVDPQVVEKKSRELAKVQNSWAKTDGTKLLKGKQVDQAFDKIVLKTPTESVDTRVKVSADPKVVWIEGMAAQVIYSAMSAVPSIPAQLDFDAKPPQPIQFEMLERKVGKAMTCVRQPVVTEDSEDYVRDSHGSVIFKTRCLGYSQ